jgi:hypothetical protein
MHAEGNILTAVKPTYTLKKKKQMGRQTANLSSNEY